MNRNSILSFIIVAIGTGALLATTATSQFGAPKAFVNLQPTTPGTSQSGHANVSGTVRASQFVGGGAGLTGVNADLLDGLNSTAFLQSIPNPLILSGNSSGQGIISGTNSSGSAFTPGVFGYVTDPFGLTFGVWGKSDSQIGMGVYGNATHSTGANFGGFFETPSTAGVGVTGVAGNATGATNGVLGRSFSSSGIGVNGVATATSGATIGVQGEVSSPAGKGVLGKATSTSGETFGVWGQSASDNGKGVFGFATAPTGFTRGVWGQSASSSGLAVYGFAQSATGQTTGGSFENVSTSGKGVFGGAYASSGLTIGVHGQSSSNSGLAVYGHAISGSGVTYGVYGLVNSPDGFAGYFQGRAQVTGNMGIGIAPSTRRLEVSASDPFVETAHINNSDGGGLRVDALNGSAVWALTTNGFAGVDARNGTTSTYAVYGHAYSGTGTAVGVVGQSSSPTGWGVYSFGNMGSTGVKPFRIDHPFDPENKYLLHYAAESPMPQNFYVGNVVTDTKGYAWVELPNYFEEININFKYQLTIIDDADSEAFVQAKISKRIRNNQFQIRTNAPNTEVSWRVDADRNDLYVRDRKPKDVVEKQGRERGKYQHPELYGMPKERGTNYLAETEKPLKNPRKQGR